jgi:beta-glucosidase-like glycosyl hydrolase
VVQSFGLRRAAATGVIVAVVLASARADAPALSGVGGPLDKTAAKWVDDTFRRMSLDDKVGQLLVSSFESTYTSTDSDVFDALASLVRNQRVGGFHVFGGSEPVPGVLLNPTYGPVILGQPLAAASMINRLQALSTIPLLNTADFETGAGMRLAGATTFPKAMAFGAANDERLTFEAGRITALESRAVGIHVNFAPVADVNNNARNPVINIRSFGEDPARVGALASAFAKGLQAGGMLATLKHFPGHGDTDVDSHLGLPLIPHARPRLDQVELRPFRAGIAAGAAAVMTAHIELPEIDPTPSTPATLSRATVTGLLRADLGFPGLIYTDSMRMDAVSKMLTAGEAALRAIQAGNDIVLHSADDRAAFTALRDAIERGALDRAQVDESVRRILTAKARLGLHRTRTVKLDDVPNAVGVRAHRAVSAEVSEKSITLIKDERNTVPLPVASTASILYLSVLDYPSGWRIAAPSRTFAPELRKRWSDVTAIELSDRSTPSEIDLVRTISRRYDAIVASVFVRAASYSGRMDLSPPLVDLLRDLARGTGQRRTPFITIFFGNPYAATFLAELPAMVLTYDFYDQAELSAVRAIAGESAIGGHLPITLPGLFPAGHGLIRDAARTTAAR